MMYLNVLVSVSLILGSSPDVWPGFLGAGRSPIDPGSIPLVWSPHEHIAWTATLPGHGQSSPVIWQEIAYVTSIEGPMKDRLLITAVGLEKGDVLWQKSFQSSDPVKNTTFVSRSAPTPLVDSEGIYCFFESGDLIALDRRGEIRWKKSLSKQYGKFLNEFGLGASPLQANDRIVLLIDHPGPSYILAIQKSTGEELWRTPRTSRASWSSPALLAMDGHPQVVCSSAGTVDGYDLASGKRLWTYEAVGGNRICSPWVFGTDRFLVGSQTSREFRDEAAVRKSNFAMRIVQQGAAWTPEIVWRTEDASPSMASPVVHGGFAYWVNRVGVVYCFDAQTGQLKYAERVKQSAWATPLCLEGRIYIFGKDGLTTVLAAGATFRILAENPLWDPESVKPDLRGLERETTPERQAAAVSHAGPEVYGVAAVSGSLLIRTGDRIFCVRECGRPK